MEKIKLLVDGHFITDYGQGTRTYIIGIYNKLLNYECNLDIYFTGHSWKEVKKALPTLKRSNFIEYNTDSNLLRICFELPRIIHKYDIEYAHFQQVSPFFKNCRFITTVHDVLFKTHPQLFSSNFRISRSYLFKRSLRKSEIKLTVSKFSRETISKQFLIPQSEINITPNGIDIDDIDISKTDAQGSIFKKYKVNDFILLVSRIEKRKNHIAILNAFENLQLFDKGYSLVFIGKVASASKLLEKKIENLRERYPNKFLLLDYVEYTELRLFYKAARLFVYPSLAEGFGIPPLEAAIHKTETISSNTTAMSEYEDVGIHMFDPRKDGNLEKKLKEILENPESDKGLNKIAKNIKEKYSWDNSAKKILKLIQKIESER